MSKFIKLTNTREDIKGTPIYFNIDHITCFYDMNGPQGEKTFIYGGNPAQSWEIEETSRQVIQIINKDFDPTKK
jgi:hypothetical protein